MADWQQYAQSIFIGFIFSFLLAKLISVVVSFREENLRVVRSDSAEPNPSPPGSESGAEGTASASDVEPLIGEEKTSLTGDSDDDWEGVESTELDEVFSAATAFVAATAADKAANKVSTDVQLQLYGLYKIATEGPCGSPQPSALKMTARAKWQAWQKLGAMPPEDAMLKYIEIVTELYPSWIDGSTIKRKGGNDSDISTSDNRGPMGPVFSTYVYEEESGNELKMDAIHAFAREGDVENLIKCVESGVSVDLKDSEGRTPLHWAVDRGHLNITEMLVNKNADVNAKDNDGQTPLHYAAVCERESIAEFLVKHNADAHIEDNDGNSSHDLCDSNWPCMQREASQTA
ncbi:hypothetical protein RJ639_013276 [Escallonia herrerae]|uniref:ACB domain-containing protein n=1 Tax=Escallonia herrerae TaxID=1293975 RepID=A0AA89AMY1_9ASTE|nr:hypothetical protein RJ639_013276 [Escallonia herrerae]